MAIPESDQRELFAPTADVVRASFTSDPARVPVGRKDRWSIVRIFSLTTARARARAENGSRQGPPVPRLSLCDAQQK